MYLIDIDNLIKTKLHPTQIETVKQLIDSGETIDCCGDVLPFSDYVDGQGDLCVDDYMYEDIKEKLSL